MRNLLTISLVLLSAGCATSQVADTLPIGTGNLLGAKVIGTYHSRKTPASIAQCLEDKLGDLGLPLEWSANGGTAVSFSLGENMLALFQIAPDGTTTFRRAHARPDFQAKAEPCF
jgi:hypothetical protein